MEIAFSETAQKDIDFWKKSGNTAILKTGFFHFIILLHQAWMRGSRGDLGDSCILM